MTNSTKLIGVALLSTFGLTFLIMGCVLTGTWWTLLMFIFYGLTPVPLLLTRLGDSYENLDGDGTTDKTMDIAVFLIAGMVVSTFAFPILLSHVPVGNPALDFKNTFLAEFATLIFYTAAALFATTLNDEDD